MIKVASAPVETDLSLFSRWLTGQGLPHKIIEEGGEQAIFLQTDQYAEQVEQALCEYLKDAQFREHVNTTEPVWRISTAPKFIVPYHRTKPSQAPIIFLLIGLSLLVAWLTNFGQPGPLLRVFLIIDPLQWGTDTSSLDGRLTALIYGLMDGQLWRLISPDILHFSVLHITFNLMMLWVLGGQLEVKKGSMAFLAMVVFVSIVSNLAQLMDGGYFFGGLSGVVYGLIGYCWMWRRIDPQIFLPGPLLKFSLVWLLIGYTPLTESLGLGRMANSAHLYGLLAGLFWGWITTLLKVKSGQKAD